MSRIALIFCLGYAGLCFGEATKRTPSADSYNMNSGNVAPAAKPGGITCGSGYVRPDLLTAALVVCDTKRPYQIFSAGEQLGFRCIQVLPGK